MNLTRAASPFSSIYKRESSPLKLELQQTLHKMSDVTLLQDTVQASNVYSPLPGADNFFAASGRSMETAEVEKLAINIQQESVEEGKRQDSPSTSLGFGMPEAPDTSVFSFLGPDERSQNDKNLLSSLLSETHTERQFKTAGGIGFMKRKGPDAETLEAEQAQKKPKSGQRLESSFKKKRGTEYIRTLSKLPPPDYEQDSQKALRVKALRSKPDLDSIPSAQVLPDQHHMFSAEAFSTPVSNQKQAGGLILTKMLSRLESGSLLNQKAPHFHQMHPSLAEQLDIVRDWWEEIASGVKQRKSQDGGSVHEKEDEVLPLNSVIAYLLRRNIVANKDTVDRLIKKMLACDTLSLSYIRYQDFANLFTRSLFRECILYTAREIEKHQGRILKRSTRVDSLNRRTSGLTIDTQETQESKAKNERQSPRNKTGFGSSLGRFGEATTMELASKDRRKKEEPQFSMSFKMSSYERSLMIDGLTKGSKYFKIGREALDALINFHEPSHEDYSVYNIVRLLGELRGDQDIFLKEEAKRHITLVEEEQLPNRSEVLASLPEDIDGEDSEDGAIQQKESMKISSKGLNLLSWRRDGNADTYRSRLGPDELDSQIERLFMNEREKDAYLPNRYKNLTPRERKNRDKRLLQGLQEYYAKEDPLVKARRLEKKAAEVFEKK